MTALAYPSEDAARAAPEVIADAQRASRRERVALVRSMRVEDVPLDSRELAALHERLLPLPPRAYARLQALETEALSRYNRRRNAEPCELHGTPRGTCTRCAEAALEAHDAWREERDRERAQDEAHERVRAAVAAHLDRPAPDPGEVLCDDAVALLSGGCPEVRDAYLLGWRAGVRHDRAELVPDLLALVASVAAAAEQRGRRAGAAAVLRANRRHALRRAGRM